MDDNHHSCLYSIKLETKNNLLNLKYFKKIYFSVIIEIIFFCSTFQQSSTIVSRFNCICKKCLCRTYSENVQ